MSVSHDDPCRASDEAPAEDLAAAAVSLPQHAATAYFSARLRQLADSTEVHWLEPGAKRPRKAQQATSRLTPALIQRLLKEQAPDLPVSTTQMYRYYHGQAPPRLDVVYELARLFKVAPTFFLPTDFVADPDKKRPIPRKRPPGLPPAPTVG